MTQKIYIAGHRGMVGSAIWRKLESRPNVELMGRRSRELDLRQQSAVEAFIAAEKPEAVIMAAARVGGILANDRYPFQFLYDNLIMEANLIEACHRHAVPKVIFLGSSCIYPKHAPQPMKEEHLLTGPLEPTNEWYAIAKIAGVKLIESLRKQYGRAYVSLMPTNLYGPEDNFDLETSHVLPALMRKFHEAAQEEHRPVPVWGSGRPKREFLHVDDLAGAVAFTLDHLEHLEYPLYNVGTGEDLSIKELAEQMQAVTGHQGEIQWDATKPDGTPRKLMDVARMKEAGWRAQISLQEGLRDTYRWFLEHQEKLREVKLDS